MLRILGLSLALCLAGCATHVGAPAPDPRSDELDLAPITHSSGPSNAFDFLSVRVGVEYSPSRPSDLAGAELPRPAFRARAEARGPTGDDRVTVTALRPTTPPASEAASTGRVGEAWLLGREEIRRIEDPYEQMVLTFVDNLIGEDRRRLQREFGAPVLLTRSPRTHLPSLRNGYDERLEESDAEFNHDVIRGMIRGPLQRALRGLPIAAEFETEFQEFQKDNVPVSEAYQDQHGGASLGRVSARIRIQDSFDPVELSYLNYGVRIGSSQHYLRLEYDIDVAPGVHASVGWKKGYDNQTPDFLRASLHWRFDADNLLHVTAGDSLFFLDGPTAYENVASRLDGTRGILFYVEHLF